MAVSWFVRALLLPSILLHASTIEQHSSALTKSIKPRNENVHHVISVTTKQAIECPFNVTHRCTDLLLKSTHTHTRFKNKLPRFLWNMQFISRFKRWHDNNGQLEGGTYESLYIHPTNERTNERIAPLIWTTKHKLFNDDAMFGWNLSVGGPFRPNYHNALTHKSPSHFSQLWTQIIMMMKKY